MPFQHLMRRDTCMHITFTSIKLSPYLYAKVSPVNIITQEEVACCGRWSTNFEQFHKVIKLTMNVSTDYNVRRKQIQFKNMSATTIFLK